MLGFEAWDMVTSIQIQMFNYSADGWALLKGGGIYLIKKDWGGLGVIIMLTICLEKHTTSQAIATQNAG